MKKITEVKPFIFLYEKLEPKEIKTIISLVKKAPHQKYNNVSRTDWGITSLDEEPYFNYVWECLKDFRKAYCDLFGMPILTIDGSSWFQIYKKNSHHDWHNHPKTNFTNVLYLKGGSCLQTELADHQLNDIVYPGTILTFPGFMKHRSKINTDSKEKIIISFNTSLTDKYKTQV